MDKMKTIPGRIEELEQRMSTIEQMLGISTTEPKVDSKTVIYEIASEVVERIIDKKEMNSLELVIIDSCNEIPIENRRDFYRHMNSLFLNVLLNRLDSTPKGTEEHVIRARNIVLSILNADEDKQKIDPEKVIVREPLIIKESESKPKKQKVEPKPEEVVNGFTKDQLRVMYSWAKGLKLNQLMKGDFEELKKWGMLWEFYPDAPEYYEEIKR